MNENKTRVIIYEPPRVEVVEATVEKGFAASVNMGDIGIGDWNNGGGNDLFTDYE